MGTKLESALAVDADGHTAGARAAGDAIERLDTDQVDFCQVFVADRYEYASVLDGIRSVIGAEPDLIGCSSAGEFTHRATGNGCVSLALVSSDEMRFFTGIGTGLGDDVPSAVRDAIREFPSQVEGFPYQSAITLHDGLTGVGEQLSIVTQKKLGPQVSLAGGSAGDGMAMEQTHVFCDDRIETDAVVMALITSKKPLAIAVDHGHLPLSEPLTVTRSEGGVVHELDGRPAFDVWKDCVRDHALAEFDIDVEAVEPESTELTKLMTRYEFGIDQGRAYKIRWPGLTTTTDGRLHFAVSVPEGTVFRVMHSPIDNQIDAIRAAGRTALEQLEGDPAGGFVYDCVCRSVILDDQFGDAIGVLADDLGVPFAGFETYGEICMERGQTSGYHNTTAVVMLLPR